MNRRAGVKVAAARAESPRRAKRQTERAPQPPGPLAAPPARRTYMKGNRYWVLKEPK